MVENTLRNFHAYFFHYESHSAQTLQRKIQLESRKYKGEERRRFEMVSDVAAILRILE